MATYATLSQRYQQAVLLRISHPSLMVEVGPIVRNHLQYHEKESIFQDFRHIIDWLFDGLGAGALPDVPGMAAGCFPPSCPPLHKLVRPRLERMEMLGGFRGKQLMLLFAFFSWATRFILAS
jgi:hypothetical protein